MRDDLKLTKKYEDYFSADYTYDYMGYRLEEHYLHEEDCDHHGVSVYLGDEKLAQFNYGGCLEDAMDFVDGLIKEKKMKPIETIIAELNVVRSNDCSKEKSEELKALINDLLPYVDILHAIKTNFKISVRDKGVFNTPGTYIACIDGDLFKAKSITKKEYEVLKEWLEI